MKKLSDLGLSKDEAIAQAKVFFNNKTEFVSLLEKNMDPNQKDQF